MLTWIPSALAGWHRTWDEAPERWDELRILGDDAIAPAVLATVLQWWITALRKGAWGAEQETPAHNQLKERAAW
jgi:hypothetical protein